MSAEVSMPITNGGSDPSQPKSIYSNVQDHYGQVARGASSGSYGVAVASAFGYSKEELTNIPADSNLGLSCGNPFAIANLREGETVVDLGSGAGFDVFQAAKKVGSSGSAIGVDMNEEMLARANKIKGTIKADNVSFVDSPITKINMPDATADCIISNCVVNLVPEDEKPLVFGEMYRLLKPGGRIAISDLLLKKDLPSELKSNIALYVGCVSGASEVGQYKQYLREAGFEDIMIVADQSDLNVYKTANDNKSEGGCCGPSSKAKTSCSGNQGVPDPTTIYQDVDLNEWAASFKIYAVKGQ